MSSVEAHLVPFLVQNEGLVEDTGSHPYPSVVQNPTQHTAARGVNEGNYTERPTCANSIHTLENKAHEGNKQQNVAHSVNCLNYTHRMARDSMRLS